MHLYGSVRALKLENVQVHHLGTLLLRRCLVVHTFHPKWWALPAAPAKIDVQNAKYRGNKRLSFTTAFRTRRVKARASALRMSCRCLVSLRPTFGYPASALWLCYGHPRISPQPPRTIQKPLHLEQKHVISNTKKAASGLIARKLRPLPDLFPGNKAASGLIARKLRPRAKPSFLPAVGESASPCGDLGYERNQNGRRGTYLGLPRTGGQQQHRGSKAHRLRWGEGVLLEDSRSTNSPAIRSTEHLSHNNICCVKALA